MILHLIGSRCRRWGHGLGKPRVLDVIIYASDFLHIIVGLANLHED